MKQKTQQESANMKTTVEKQTPRPKTGAARRAAARLFAAAPKHAEPFNMVEITLAIAVVAIGVTAVMGLFPPAIEASRTAVADSSSSGVVETLQGYIERQLMKQDDWTSISSVPAAKLTEEATINAANNPNDAVKWAPNPNLPSGLYMLNSTDGFWGVKSGNFSAHLLVWREQILPFYDTVDEGTVDTSTSNKAIRLCCELSWPLTLEYAKRNKRFYVLELYKR